MMPIRKVLAESSRRDSGLTLIELLVTMILLGVVSTLVVTAVQQSVRILTHTDDEATGLGDAKVILDRLGRDIREAREAVCFDPSGLDSECFTHIELWIDENSDYARQDEEIVTWELRPNADGVHYDVWRVVGPLAAPDSEQRQASSLVVDLAFCYDDSDPCVTGYDQDVEQIRLRMTYDSIIDRGTQTREVAFAARLRNKG